MNCHIHGEVDAIGVCFHCGQGVCDACAVSVGGKQVLQGRRSARTRFWNPTRALVVVAIIIAVVGTVILLHPVPAVAAQPTSNPTRSVPEFPGGTMALVALVLPAILLFRQYNGVRSRSM